MPAELTLPAPIGLQPAWIDSPASRKVLRVGRRGGKSRFDLVAAVAGHGPGEEGQRKFPGILQGGDVVWIAQDYPNLTTVIWREEIVPRFERLPQAKINGQEHWVSLRGLGTLFLRSAEAISGIRGIGKNLKGVIIDEAAHLDLEKALLDVVLPALLDNDGWLILSSTTNAGPDGNVEKRVPSYFNVICEEIRRGERGPEWAEFSGTAYDNPAIDNSGIDELVNEYVPDSVPLKQEVYAELLTAGVGLALPMVDEKVHIVERFRVPEHWRQFGAFDWGYNHPWCFEWCCIDEDGQVTVIDTVWGREDLPEAIADKVEAAGVPASELRAIVAGTDIWHQKDRSIRQSKQDTGITIEQRLRKRGWTCVPADTRRVLGLDNLRAFLSHEVPTEERPGGKPPRLVLMDTGQKPTREVVGSGNRRVLHQLATRQLDEKNLEDAAKMDADTAGRGGDDGYDCTRYGMMWVRLGMKSAGVETRPSVEEMLKQAEKEEHIDASIEKRIAGRLSRKSRRGGGGNGKAPLLGVR